MADILVVILGILAAAGSFLLWRNQRLRDTVADQKQTIKAHERIQEIHQQDQAAAREVDRRIEEVRDNVEKAETPEQGAGAVASALDAIFLRRKE